MDIEPLKACQAIETYIHPELRKGIGSGTDKGNSQADAKSKCLIDKCLPCHADKALRLKKVISGKALFLVQAPFLNSFRQVREGKKLC